jgi:hypothetical protein
LGLHANENKTKDLIGFSPKLVQNLVWSPVIFVQKCTIPLYMFYPQLNAIRGILMPNCEHLLDKLNIYKEGKKWNQITLFIKIFYFLINENYGFL